MKISQIIYEEAPAWKDYIHDDGFNQYETIKRINCYVQDKYYDRDNDVIFWGLSAPRIIHFAKNIDLDTKNLVPYGIGDTNVLQAWIAKIKFQKWARDNKFALTLNDLSEGLATYGSTVWKKCYDEDGKAFLDECDLLNLRFDTKAKDIRKTPIIEFHEMSEYDLRDKMEVWDEVERAIELGKGDKRENEIVKYEVWERWGEIKNDEDKMIYSHYIGWGQGDKETIFLEEEDIDRDECPYYDFHLGKYKNRWLRVGVVQRLFKIQSQANKLVNQDDKTADIASLLLLRTANGETNGNVLTQVLSGQIINSPDLQQIQLQNPGINDFLNKMAMIERQADKLCMTPEIITGENLPAGTPFRGMAVLSNAAKSAFDYLRQSVGEKVGYILHDVILPDVLKDWNKEELEEIMEDEKDIEIYDQVIMDKKRVKMLYDANVEGRIITPEEMAKFEEDVQKENQMIGRKIKTPKGFFNFKYGFRINPTGESIDKSQQNDAMFNALQMVQGNPAIIDIPLFRQYLENNGLNWWKLTPRQLQNFVQTSQQMGGKMGGEAIAKRGEDKLLNLVDSTPQ